MDILENGLIGLMNLSRELAALIYGPKLASHRRLLRARVNGDVDAGQRPLVVDEPGLAGTAAEDCPKSATRSSAVFSRRGPARFA